MNPRKLPMNKGEWIALSIGLIVIILIIVFIIMKGPNTSSDSSNAGATVGVTVNNGQTSATGTVAVAGSTVTVNYVGTLQNGTKFDSSYDRGQPFSFVLGSGQVIKGWDTGVLGMKVGETRHLVIPPDQAYGSAGVKNPQTGGYVIPPNSTLIFDVTLISVQAPGAGN